MAGSRIDMPGFWGGLSARLVVLTIVFVMVAEVLIFVPSISRFRVDYLREKIDAAFGDLPEGVREKVLFANAAELYDVETPDHAWRGPLSSVVD